MPVPAGGGRAGGGAGGAHGAGGAGGSPAGGPGNAGPPTGVGVPAGGPSGNGAGGEGGGAAVCRPRPPGRAAPDFSQVSLPQGRIGANPHHEHLTGLESWFWYEGHVTAAWTSPVFPGVAEDCSVVPPPPAGTYRAALVDLTWHVGDSRPGVYMSRGAGSEEQPAARHVYETKGTWTVSVVCTWRGEWGGQVSRPCAQRELDVIEVRAGFSADR